MHSWNDGADRDESDVPMGHRVDQRLEPDPWFYSEDSSTPRRETRSSARARLRSRGVARAMADDDNDEAPW